jgi:cytochrome c peroxidase
MKNSLRRICSRAFLLFLRPWLIAASVAFAVLPARAATPASLASPTGVTASDGAYANKVGITWDAVPYATAYRVYRATANNPAVAATLGATASWVFWDTTAAAGQTYFYWVRAENGAVVSALSAADSGVRAAAGRPGQGAPPLEPPPEPAGNPVTAAKVALGKALFWDEQLSATNTMACGTCHAPRKGGADLRAVLGQSRSQHPGPDGIYGNADDVTGSPGVPGNAIDGSYVWDAARGYREQVTARYPRATTEAAYADELFWDGRAAGAFTDPLSGAVALASGGALESQVLGPPLNAGEMAHAGRNWADLTVRLAHAWPLALASGVPGGLANWIAGRTYPQLFEEAFGTAEITPARLAFAIASYERTLFSDRTPFDLAQAQIAALPAAAERGRTVFLNSRCNVCHAGSLHSDGQFHNIGLRPVNATEDAGRFAVTGDPADRGRFRTPSLRNAGLRGPFMHTGSLATLADVVNFYDRGGDFNAPNKDPAIRPLGLSAQEKGDLVAYLQALTDPRVAAEQFPFDRPELFAGSARAPQITGAGIAGSGGAVPAAIAAEPPLIGGRRFTTALTGGLGGAAAVLVFDPQVPPAGRIPAAGEVAQRVTLTLEGTGAGNGHASCNWTPPGEARLAGTRYFGRWYVNDPAAPGGVAASALIDFTLVGGHDAEDLSGTSRLANISARALAGGVAGTPITGIVVGGTGAKRVLIRAAGPALAALGVGSPLADPRFDVYKDGAVIAGNDNWLAGDAAGMAALGAFALPAGSKDAGLFVTLPTGNSSAPVVSVDGANGVSLLEVYDADSAPGTATLTGLSARGYVGTGDSVLIAGFVVGGEGARTLLIRAVGPSLVPLGVGDAVADPQITLYRGGTALLANDNWSAAGNASDLAAAAAKVGDFALPAGSKDAALLVTLPAGIYSAVVKGAGGQTGTALLELYVIE